MNWFYHDGTREIGPLDEQQTETLVRQNVINRNTAVWREGLSAWTEASETELMKLFATPPPVNAPARPPPYPPPPSSPSQTPVDAQPQVPISQPTVAAQMAAAGTRMVMPRNPPRSVGWMTFWGFIWPGLGQCLCGQASKGGVLMATSCILNIFLSVTVILPIGICVAGAIDANKVAKRLAKGQPVGEWEFFPAT